MKVHIVADTHIRGNGVYTAFVDHMNLLRSEPDVETVINNKGWGDVMHSHTYGPHYFLKGMFYKGRRVYTAHVIPDSIKGSIPGWKHLMPLANWYLKKVYSYADVCIAISPMVEKAIRQLDAKTEIVRIDNPIDTKLWKRTPELRAEGRALLGIGKDEFVVLGVGQLQARKGVEDFIDMAEALPEARFVWVGGRPLHVITEGISRIDSRIETAPSNTVFAGMFELDHMPMLYAAADLFIFPSYQENCPLAPLEAAASGMPVVFRDIPEYQSLYESPYLKAGTTEEFIKIARQLMQEPAYYQLGKYFSGQLINQFDKTEIRKRLMDVYERLTVTYRGHRSLFAHT